RECSTARRVEAHWPRPHGRTRASLQARASANLSLLLRAPTLPRRLELLFRACALRQGRLRDSSSAADLSAAQLPAQHALLDPAVQFWPIKRPLIQPPTLSIV